MNYFVDNIAVYSKVSVILSAVKDLAKCPGRVRANERNVTCYNFSASAAELNGNIKSQRGFLRVAQDDN